MDKKNISNIIAREVLFLLIFLLVGSLLLFNGKALNEIYVREHMVTGIDTRFAVKPQGHGVYNFMIAAGSFIKFFGYPLYLFLRLIVWRIKILKEKNTKV